MTTCLGKSSSFALLSEFFVKYGGVQCICLIYRPRGYKKIFMLNSVEHDILIAHKYKYIKIFGSFLAQISLECYFPRS